MQPVAQRRAYVPQPVAAHAPSPHSWQRRSAGVASTSGRVGASDAERRATCAVATGAGGHVSASRGCSLIPSGSGADRGGRARLHAAAASAPGTSITGSRLQEQSQSVGVTFSWTEVLPAQDSVEGAVASIDKALQALLSDGARAAVSGVARIEISVPATYSALQWLMSQPQNSPDAAVRSATPAVPSVYFSPRSAPHPAADTVAGSLSPTCAGLGSAWAWRGEPGENLDSDVMAVMQRFLIGSGDAVKVLGGARFDPAGAISPEWAPFGTYYMILPALELVEGSTLHTLAVNVVWDAQCTVGLGSSNLAEAVSKVQSLLPHIVSPQPSDCSARPHIFLSAPCYEPTRESWSAVLRQCLHELNAPPAASDEEGGDPDDPTAELSRSAIEEFLNSPGSSADLDALLSGVSDTLPAEGSDAMSQLLTKVVLARRAGVTVKGSLHALQLLEVLQQDNPSSYQIALALPDGHAFVASTPERLFLRRGRDVTSEAVAGTRPRGGVGNIQQDFYLGLDLLRGSKEHVEFCIVRDWVRDALASVCRGVTVDTPKALLKQRHVQHLYGKLSGTLQRNKNDADLLAALHPTPAVCGRPQADAYEFLQQHETFDRGFYAGPFGFMSGSSAEFVVGIRSALVAPSPSSSTARQRGSGAQTLAASAEEQQVHVYSGVGIVRGSDAELEWQELELKAQQFWRVLRPLPPLSTARNANVVWAGLIVEELVRNGVSMFAVAPGSRSSPLTHAIAAHPRARHMLCIDERSLGFWAVGHATRTGVPVAVVTTSGTAVANLLPAVVEASLSRVPMILLTGDRPTELRHSGANQTIDQVKIFGDYVRFAEDLAPPDEHIRGAVALTSVDAVVRHATAGAPGPVHLNCQFRDPLDPGRDAPVPTCLTEALEAWEQSDDPYCAALALQSTLHGAAPMSGAGRFLVRDLTAARRGVIVACELRHSADRVAVLRLASLLGWPVIADVLSGLRVGAHSSEAVTVLHHFDTLLTDEHWVEELRSDCILQVGGHAVSKRVVNFLAHAASPSPNGAKRAPWHIVSPHPDRNDERHLVSSHLQCQPSELVLLLESEPLLSTVQTATYRSTLRALDQAVATRMLAAVLPPGHQHAATRVTEPAVAMTIGQHLPARHALFLGSSMPIRDMDMFAQARPAATAGRCDLCHGLGAPVAANRGASGIDGVISSAAGFAAAMSAPTTLVLGDVSFVHDTNGLMFLHDQPLTAPLTVVVVNNSGGGIFHFLPIAGAVEPDEFSSMWATPPNIDIQGLCRSHHVPYQRVSTTDHFLPALRSAWALNAPSVVEVITDRHDNVAVHRAIQAQCTQAARQAYAAMRAPPFHVPSANDNGNGNGNGNGTSIYNSAATSVNVPGDPHFVLRSLHWDGYELPLTAPLTTSAGAAHVRAGSIVRVVLQTPDGEIHVGCGEAAPLPGLCTETLDQANAQLATLSKLLVSVPIASRVSLLDGAFARFWHNCVGLDPASLHPSVVFAVEGAILSAIAHARGLSLADLLRECALPAAPRDQQKGGGAAELERQSAKDYVVVNGLLDLSSGGVGAAVAQARMLAAEGYQTIKVKVARSSDPSADAQALAAIQQVCPHVSLRADANRLWSLDDALAFSRELHTLGVDLEYIEEPVSDPVSDLSAFVQMSRVPIALDESLEEGLVAPHILRSARSEPAEESSSGSELALDGVAALVVKPSVLGSIERSCALLRWASESGLKAVISTAFESSVGVTQLAALAAAFEAPNGREAGPGTAAAVRFSATAHGLGTLSWFHRDTVEPALTVTVDRGTAAAQSRVELPFAQDQHPPLAVFTLPDVHAAHRRACDAVQQFGMRGSPTQQQPDEKLLDVRIRGQACRVRAVKVPARWTPASDGADRPKVLFLHGFLGSADDWGAVMAGMREHAVDCAAIDLWGHGDSDWGAHVPVTARDGDATSVNLSMLADGVQHAIQQLGWDADYTLVGYSLGARVALEVAARKPAGLKRLVAVSGSPGLKGETHRAARLSQDANLAAALRAMRPQDFVKRWYSAPLWRSLRAHPGFQQTVAARARGADTALLAAVLEGCSPGLQNRWPELVDGSLRAKVGLVVGALDSKFVSLAKGLAGLPSNSKAEIVHARQQEGLPSSLTMRTCPGVRQHDVTNSKYPVIEVLGAGHAVHIEKPSGLLQALELLLLDN